MKKNKRSIKSLVTSISVGLLVLLTSNQAQAALAGDVVDPQDPSKALICHVPDGNPENAQTLSISPSAIAGHDIHPGDYDGVCAQTDPGVTVIPAVECQAQLGYNLRFNFANPVLEAGTAGSSAVGTTYRFPGVTTGVDALVEITQNQNAKLVQIDVPSLEEDPVNGTGLKWAFQPQVQPISKLAGEYYIDFKITFVDAGTTTATSATLSSNFLANAVDVDGDGSGDDSSNLREFVALADFYQYFTEQPTHLDISPSTLGVAGQRFISRTDRNLPGITPFNTVAVPYASEHVASAKYDGINEFNYRAGVKLDAEYIDIYDERLFSLFFNCVEFDNPNVLYDLGDAPASYGEAKHAISDTVAVPSLYLGSVYPDSEIDLTTKKAKKAVPGYADDEVDEDDEDGVSSFPALRVNDTAYTIPAANITLVNNLASDAYLYGFIDFNRDGDFEDSGEMVKISVPAGANAPSADLSWSGLSGLTMGNTFARFRLSTNPSLSATGIAGDGEVEDYPLAIEDNLCSVFTGEVSEAGLPITSILKAAEKLFLPSKSTAANEGHLRAYTINSSGVASTTVDWDAATLMNATKRKAAFYSSDASGNITLFDSLDNAAFSSDPATVKSTIFAASLGSISRGNSLDIISNNRNTALYLYETAYRTFYAGTVSSRDKRVLTTSDDGFLYAFDYDTGELSWAWMPRSLVTELADASYQSKQLMAGSLQILDLKDNTGNYATYIIGSYKHGLGHFVLKLDADGNPDTLVWDDDQSGTYATSANNGEMEFFRDDNGLVHAIYVLNTSAGTSRLVIKSLVDVSADLDIDLNYKATSTPFIMQDYGKSNAPAKKTLYLGTDTGDIHAVKVLTAGGVLESATNIKTGLEDAAVTSTDDNPTDDVIYIGSSIAAKDNRYYLSAQTPTRLTVFMYDSVAKIWKKKWTSYVSGAGTWNDSGTYTADNSGVPADQGGFFITPPTTGIQSLPTDASITGKAVIVGDTVVLPLTVLPASSANCYGQAMYYLYSLTNGHFPNKTFFKVDRSAIDSNIALGYGEAHKLTITDLSGKDQLLAYGLSDQKLDKTVGLAEPFVIKDPVATGIRGWKEIGR